MARTRSRTGYGQLTLLAALLFGIVTMHTLGHPSGGHESGHETGPSAAHSRMQSDRGEVGPSHGDRVMSVAAPAPEPHGGMAMDPLSVCLAVLGAFTLVLLLRAGPLRPGGTLARTPGLGRLLHSVGPEPPPPRALLTRLSVLRQ
ncbi:hypothetical protein AB0B50_16355 [Streptomyces sp. NPDC041068]|uniref:hypothetical protein n=1 Tax=Streptomyces sp. NPDC041068 TaxID=3155130 RepID=UPI0033E61600